VSRVLFVVPPLVGHINPSVSVAAALADLGHEVAWAGHGEVVRPLLPAGARLFDLGPARAGDTPEDAERSRRLRGLESLKFLWETLLVPLARAMRPQVEAAIAELRPDVVVVDQQAVGGALAARRQKVPWATLCTTSAGVTDPLAGLPKVKAWVAERLAGLEAEAGLSAAAAPELSPTCVLVLSTEALIGEAEARALPRHFRLVGPAFRGRPDATPFPWEALDRDPARRRVLVSLGTISADRDGDFYATCAAALGDSLWQVILVAPPGALPSPPPNFLVAPRVPQVALLPHLQAVVSHGGHNTVCEALAHAVPLVVTPIRDDQPVVAEQVTRAGAGVRLRFGRLAPLALREAVGRVLEEPAFAAAARRVAESFARAGGAEAAARAILELSP